MTLSGKGYPCSAGETFDSVALLLYGDEKYAAELLNANPHLCTIPVFTGGEMLLLPVIEMPEDEDEEAKMPDVPPWKEA
ncbi:MAG: tail protein X [Clostridia bacterium]|jgi:hypothetical protein|nr:tail protein X [Clostridia bacterium]